ncbi:MAG: hypothetical protein J7K65_08890 [Planctomycetes bacterium]|nr:hypothetical protein [Planctomycetota bacterium]
MEMDFATPENKNAGAKSGKHITAFTAIKQDYGLQIKVAGCVCLRAAQNGSKDVIGIVKLDDQVVPILDSRKDACGSISDLSCIVLFENVVGQTTIVTGRLYESACQVFDLIVECMDEPETHDRLYAISEHHQVCETAE